MNTGPIAKSITALITGLIGWATTVAAHPGGFNNITAPLWIALATVVAVAFGVFAVPNAPQSQ